MADSPSTAAVDSRRSSLRALDAANVGGMTYSVKEIFYTLQGEGAQAGRAAVFCRFAGCNLWSGREEDRSSAVCKFCDTDFVGTNGVGGGRFESAESLAAAIEKTWAGDSSRTSTSDRKFVVVTGGEPLLQLDIELIKAIKKNNFEIAVETNGTLPAPPGIDWVCVSPKSNSRLVQKSGQELKLVYPQADAQPCAFEHLDFEHMFLQPMDGPDRDRNTQLAVAYCLKNPRWRVSIQTHKLIGIP